MLQLIGKKASGSGGVCALEQWSERKGKPKNCPSIVAASLAMLKLIKSSWKNYLGEMLRTICWIPVVVAESGHLKDKLVTAIVFIGSFHLRQWSKAVPLLCLPCVFSFGGGHNWTIWLWIISAIQREREGERDITCCHDNKRWWGVYLKLSSAQGFTSSCIWRLVFGELLLRELIPPAKHCLHLCSFTPGYVEDISLKAQPRTEQRLYLQKAGCSSGMGILPSLQLWKTSQSSACCL